MSEHDGNRQLERERLAYRYSLALEAGDIDSLAMLWEQAREDAEMETMLLELQQAYQVEAQLPATDAEVQTAHRQLSSLFLPSERAETREKASSPVKRSILGVAIHSQSKARRLQHMQIHTGEKTQGREEAISFPIRARHHRLIRLVQSLVAVLVVGSIIAGFLFLSGYKHAGNTVLVGGGNPVMGKWQIVPSPNPQANSNELYNIAVVSPTDAWAVGYSWEPRIQTSLIEHWNGKQWSTVPDVPPDNNIRSLSGISALSATNIWAVGNITHIPTGGKSTLIEHWDGKQWSIVPSPNTSKPSNSLSSIIALSPDNIWASGVSSSEGQDAGHNDGRTLIEHWNGSQWSIVPSPNGAFSYNMLLGMTAISKNNIWAAGISYDISKGVKSQALIEHWNGSQWSIVPSPNPGAAGSALFNISAASANDIWAVGTTFVNGNDLDSHTLIEHWNGKQWQVIPGPQGQAKMNVLVAIVAVSANDVWATGTSSNDAHTEEGKILIQHWDGTRWQMVASPKPAGNAVLRGIAAVPNSNQLWAVGDFITSGKQTQTLIAQYK